MANKIEILYIEGMEAFRRVLQAPKTMINDIVWRISEAAQVESQDKEIYHFRDLMMNLPAIKIEKNSVYIGGRHIHNLQERYVGKGSYSVCFISEDSSTVYKEISISAKNKYYSKTGYMDAEICSVYTATFVQALLAADPDIGRFICKPLKLFRDAATRRTSLRSSSEAQLSDIKLYIQMEPVTYKLGKYLKTLYFRHGRRLEFIDIAPLFLEIGQTLVVMGEKYGATHGDMHVGNIMVTADGHLKLIDFTFTRLTYEGQRIRYVECCELTNPEYVCYDLLVFLCSFIEYEAPVYLSGPAQTLIQEFLDTENGNLYDMLREHEDRDTPTFHMAYPDRLYDYDLLEKVEKCEMLIPANFVRAVQEKCDL